MSKPRFALESDVRAEVREAFPTAQWVEAAVGGSHGLPDCFINDVDGIKSRVAFFELKVAEVRGCEAKYFVRPAQRKRLKKMMPAGYRVWFLIGEKGGERLWKVAVDERSMNGRFTVGDPGVVPILDLREELLAGSF
jgi:hypothetical protein